MNHWDPPSPSDWLAGRAKDSRTTCPLAAQFQCPMSATSHIASSHFLFSPGTREVAAKPSAITTRQPRAREQERKKGSLTSSLRMEPHSRAGKSKKSAKFRSISRSLILCNAKTSDDGSSPDERYPDPFEISLGQGKEGIFHSSVQLADTSEAGPSSIPDLALASEAAPLPAAGSDQGKKGRRMFFMKVCPALERAWGRFLVL